MSTAPNFRPFKTAQENREDFHAEIDKDDALDENRKRKRMSKSRPVFLKDIRAHIDRYGSDFL